ncbi:RagB/SusD family nutrient uptake outer membrane protein [Mariniphaga sediminis]|uniref:RagB/SusD family nutrient uptake outer membrane protein n=1 Tax=Mariniphaga sediminis TaxID=1628158 RepID=UPI003563C901
MKIKNILVIAGVVLLMLISFSCNDDILEQHPLDQISSQTFWKNEAEVKMAVAGCYARLIGTMLDFRRGYMDGLADNGYAYWGWYNIENMLLGNINSSSGGLIDIIYYSSYKGISQCNFFLDNIEKATAVDQNILNITKGEVRFLRALFYFELVNCFGDVIMYKETPESAEASKIAKSPKGDVLEFIHQDLDFAISNLPDENYTNGHAVKGSAMALKTRVLLTEEKWSEAASLAQQIMSSGKFSIYPDYASMFFNEGQVNNPEIMFACEYLSPDSYHSVYGANMEYTSSVFLRQSLFDAYECIDGKTIEESPLYNPENPYENRDPRFNATVRFPDENWEGYFSTTTFNPTGVLNKKHVDYLLPATYANSYLNDWNFILLRYADVLLMYAEAKNEASGPDQSVYDAINEVRARPSVDMPPVDQSKYNTKELVREFIRHERQVELAMEGVRYFDLKRWRIAHIIMPALKNPEGSFYVFEEKHYNWPFPQDELDNNPNLVQTNGY